MTDSAFRIASIVGLICGTVLVTIVATVYTFNRPRVPRADETLGQKQIDKVLATLRRAFGPSWPYLFLGYAVLLIALSLVLMRKRGATATVEFESPEAGKRVALLLVCILIVLVIGVVLAFLHVYLNPELYSIESAEERATSQSPGDLEAEKKRRENIVYTAALVLIVLFGAALLGGYLIARFRETT